MCTNCNCQAKKVVHYKKDLNNFIAVGERAYILPIDHPTCRNQGHLAKTSEVLSIDNATGDFETKNTFYKLEK